MMSLNSLKFFNLLSQGLHNGCGLNSSFTLRSRGLNSVNLLGHGKQLLVGFRKEIFAIIHVFNKSTQPATTWISVTGRLIDFFRRLHWIALRHVHGRNATYRNREICVYFGGNTLRSPVGLVLTKTL